MSLVDNGGQDKRVMRFEPTTFTLATCKPTAVKPSPNNDLEIDAPAARSAFAAPSAQNPVETARNDPDLAVVVEAWPTLPEAVRAGILAMVKAAARG